MAVPEALVARLAATGARVELAAPLAKRTWWRVGGAADLHVTVHDTTSLREAVALAGAERLPVTVLGKGSNVLVADAGVRGVVLRLAGALASIDVDGDQLVLGGGAGLVSLVSRALESGWTGLEWAAGIPGSAGGAVRMNAGTHLGDLSRSCVGVEVVTPDGAVTWLSAETLAFGYRTSALPPGAVVCRVALRLERGDAAASRAAIEAHLARRAATQPVDVPTCGSTFRNPPGDSAGRLIEATGLKGHVRGRVRVSPKHANFVENLGGANATEIAALIAWVQSEVHASHGVWLHPEIVRIGEWPG